MCLHSGWSCALTAPTYFPSLFNFPSILWAHLSLIWCVHCCSLVQLFVCNLLERLLFWPAPVGILCKTSALVLSFSACLWLLLCVQPAEELLVFVSFKLHSLLLSSSGTFPQTPNIFYWLQIYLICNFAFKCSIKSHLFEELAKCGIPTITSSLDD